MLKTKILSMRNLFFVGILCLSACTSFKQSSDTVEYDSNGVVEKPTMKNGKCYAKAMIPDKFGKSSKVYPVYTGDGKPDGVEEQTIVLQDPTTKWVKKKSDANCLSADPNDCYVWCLVEVPSEKVVAMIVKDTTKIKAFQMQSFEKNTLLETGGVTKLVEVLCENDENTSIFQNLSTALLRRGYLKATQNTKNEVLIAALVQFQKDKGLPVGNINIKTLEALGVTKE
jgi:hypothetical protein